MELSKSKTRNHSFKGGFLFWVITLTIVLIATIIGAIAIGSTYIEPGVVYKVLLNKLSNLLTFKSLDTNKVKLFFSPST